MTLGYAANGAGAPAVGGSSGSQGGSGPNPGGGGAGNGPDQGGAEPLPFNGYANPTLTESLINTVKMNEQEGVINSDRNAGRVIDGRGPYKFVTTKLPTAEYPIDGGSGWMFTTNSPFYANDGARSALIDASQERPVTVTIKEDGTFTISRP